MKHLSDEILVPFKEGSPKAFKEIFDHYFVPILNFCKRLAGDPMVAEEIASNTLQKLYEKHNSFGTLQNIKAFLYITARNSCLDHLKSINRQKQRSAELNAIPWHDAVTPPYIEAMCYAEVLEEIYSMIESLSPQQKRIFNLIYRENYSTSEVAEILNISTSAVNTQKKRAIEFLRENMIDKPLLFAGLVIFMGIQRS